MKNIAVMLAIVFSIQVIYSKTLYPQDLFSFDIKNKVYYTNKDITIAANDTLFVHKGARLAFAPFCGIDLKGSLECIGTIEESIFFTSKNDIAGKGAAFDWKGIVLYPSSKIDLQNVYLKYSSFGINSCCNNVHLYNVVFFKNGKSNLKIGDRSLDITDNVLFSFGRYAENKDFADVLPSTSLSPNKYQKINDVLIPPLNYLYIPTSITLITGGTIYISKMLKTHTKYQDYRPGNLNYDKSFSYERRKEIERLRKKFTTELSLGSTLSTCGVALGVYTIYYTITF
jgi:hypothetical protein